MSCSTCFSALADFPHFYATERRQLRLTLKPRFDLATAFNYTSGQSNKERGNMSEGGKRRIPTPTGRYYDDFAVGDIYEHRPGRTITESDNINFSLMTMNQHPMHCDANFAAKSEFKRPLVNSALTLAVVVGMTVND